MKIETINIKDGFPPSDVAVADMEIAIEQFDKSETRALKVIHGYGSHGVGGEIKKLARQRLVELKKRNKILDFIPGEKFGEQEKHDYFILENFPELILDSDLKNYNSGITLVFLKNKNWLFGIYCLCNYLAIMYCVWYNPLIGEILCLHTEVTEL